MFFSNEFIFPESSNIKLHKIAKKEEEENKITQSQAKSSSQQTQKPIKNENKSQIKLLSRQLSRNAQVTPSRLQPLKKRPKLDPEDKKKIKLKEEKRDQDSDDYDNFGDELNDEDFEGLDDQISELKDEDFEGIELSDDDFSIASDELEKSRPKPAIPDLKKEEIKIKTEIPVICLDSSDSETEAPSSSKTKIEQETQTHPKTPPKILFSTPSIANLLASKTPKTSIIKNIHIIKPTLFRLVFTDGTGTAVSSGDVSEVFEKYFKERNVKFEAEKIGQACLSLQLRRLVEFEGSLKLEVRRVVGLEFFDF